MTPRRSVLLATAFSLLASVAGAQLSVTIKDIGPDRSNNSDPDGASGGRVNRLGIARSLPSRVYAASEFGGLFRSNDGGINWFHLDGHVPTVTQDVKVDPTNSNRIYATSLFDGRVNSRSGINVSGDGGVTWTHPATATPAAGFCETEIRRRELCCVPHRHRSHQRGACVHRHELRPRRQHRRRRDLDVPRSDARRHRERRQRRRGPSRRHHRPLWRRRPPPVDRRRRHLEHRLRTPPAVGTMLDRGLAGRGACALRRRRHLHLRER